MTQEAVTKTLPTEAMFLAAKREFFRRTGGSLSSVIFEAMWQVAEAALIAKARI